MHGKISVLIETKQSFTEKDEKQLFEYIKLEKELTQNNIIGILANTKNDKIKVWKNAEHVSQETKLSTFDEYVEFFNEERINDKEKVMLSTYKLNELLHRNDIDEGLRSQFVGTCLLALKNDCSYNGLSTKQIITGIEDTLSELLKSDSSLARKEKLEILSKNVLNNQKVKSLGAENFSEILNFIKNNIIPFINDKTNAGQDLLNLFFTTFNKYVGKKDKNQAYTPDHIVHFMCKVAKIDRNSVVLDPTCGSGAFLVQAMAAAIKNCRTKEEEDNVKASQIFGIESEEKAFGLATTNMLIHGDGNSNIVKDSCFDKPDWIKKAKINTILMNPPYNAKPVNISKEITKNWKKDMKEDPTKGFCFVNYVADTVKNGKLLCLLPLACAIGNSSEIEEQKRKILENNTLEAVFTLPPEMFHPGASANACCMVFNLNKPHPDNYETFFGYYKEDGFIKKKNLGRVDVKNKWTDIEKEWLHLYENRIGKAGLSAKRIIKHTDEWLCEAYMETDYSTLLQKDFENTVRSYLAYLITTGYDLYKNIKNNTRYQQNKPLSPKKWREFKISDLFNVSLSKGDLKINDCLIGNVPLVSSGETNNGCIGYIDESGDGKAEIFSSNLLTVDMFCNAYYQPNDFFAVSHGRVNILEAKFDLNIYIALFICTLINNEKFRFTYGRAVYSNVISNLKINLPITLKGNPDWKYMENYIKSLPYSDLI